METVVEDANMNGINIAGLNARIGDGITNNRSKQALNVGAFDFTKRDVRPPYNTCGHLIISPVALSPGI